MKFISFCRGRQLAKSQSVYCFSTRTDLGELRRTAVSTSRESPPRKKTPRRRVNAGGAKEEERRLGIFSPDYMFLMSREGANSSLGLTCSGPDRGRRCRSTNPCSGSSSATTDAPPYRSC